MFVTSIKDDPSEVMQRILKNPAIRGRGTKVKQVPISVF